MIRAHTFGDDLRGGLRRTKIIATLGPATDDESVLRELLVAGADAVRLNFSHGDSDSHIRRARLVQKISRDLKRHIAVVGDLQGPKIRIERFARGAAHLEVGASFILDAKLGREDGNESRVGIAYSELCRDVAAGDELLLDDGRIQLKVVAVRGEEVHTEVLIGGELTNGKGINRKGGGLSAPSITEKDENDVRVAAEICADYLAVSFPRNGEDMKRARELMRQNGLRAGVIAKIERSEALENIDGILAHSDGLMVARGDLSLEIGDAALTAVQKSLIRRARENSKIVITATEMLQSMVASSVPTRAEISDVANAVLDGTDAVMLSAETATGAHPALAVQTMARLCLGAEANAPPPAPLQVKGIFERDDSAIAMSAMYAGAGMGVAAIAALTESGATPLWMSRVLSPIPIYALTAHDATCRKIALYRGVYSGHIDNIHQTHAEVNRQIIGELKHCGAVRAGDEIIITKGDLVGKSGGTNAMKILRIPADKK